MPQPFNIRFTNKEKGNEIEVNGEIPDTDWNRLLRFKQYVMALQECGPVKNGMNVSCNVKWDIEKGLRIMAQLPNDDEISILLHRLRPFVLQNESTNFYNICGILSRYLTHSILREIIAKQRDLFSGKDFQSQIQINLNETMLNSEAVLNKWLNAFEYHRDEEKQKELELLHALLPMENSKVIFISMMIDKVKAIMEITRIVVLLEKRDGQKYQFCIFRKEGGGNDSNACTGV